MQTNFFKLVSNQIHPNLGVLCTRVPLSLYYYKNTLFFLVKTKFALVSTSQHPSTPIPIDSTPATKLNCCFVHREKP